MKMTIFTSIVHIPIFLLLVFKHFLHRFNLLFNLHCAYKMYNTEIENLHIIYTLQYYY